MAVSEIVFGGTHAETFIISVLLQNANNTDTRTDEFLVSLDTLLPDRIQ